MKVAISAVVLVLVLNPGSGLLGQQTQDVQEGPTSFRGEMRLAVASFNLPVDWKDFSKKMSLKDMLNLLMEKAAARNLDLPILVDVSPFKAEDPDFQVIDAPIRFAKKSGKTTVAEILDAALAQVPDATYFFRRNYIEITTTQSMLEESPCAAFRITDAELDPKQAKGKQDTMAIPGGLLDVAAGVAYLTGPRGGIDAVELATGKVLWSSQAVSRPLAIDGNRLVCFSPETMHPSLRLIVLDRRYQGKILQTSEPLTFPGWTSVKERWGRQLTLQWCGAHKGAWYLDWEAEAWWDQGFQTDLPAACKKARGVFRISKKSLRIRPADALPDGLYRQDRRNGFPGGKQKRVEAAQNKHVPNVAGTLRVPLLGPDRTGDGTRSVPATLCNLDCNGDGTRSVPATLPNVGMRLTAGKKEYGWKISLVPIRERERRLVRNQHLQVIDAKTGRILWERDLEPFFMGLYVETPGAWQSRGPVTVAALVQELKSKDAGRRRAVAEQIGQFGRSAKTAMPTLLQTLQDPDVGVRLTAAEAIMRIEPNANALTTLTRALKHKDRLVRAAAAESLGRMRAESGVDDLCSVLLTDPEPLVRSHAATALGRIRFAARNAVPALAKALNDGDGSVRFWAAGSLFRFGRETRLALPALGEALKSKDDSVRQSAYWSLRWHGDAGVSALCAALRDKNSDYHGEYAEVINQIQTATKASFPTMLPFLWDGERAVRYQAARALYRLDKKRALDPVVEVLCQLLSENDWEEGTTGYPNERELLNALEAMGPDAKKAVPLLCQVLQSRGTGEKALGEIGKDAQAAVPFLKKALQSKIDAVRIQTALALWRITGSKNPSFDVLVREFGGSHKNLCWQAMEAIGEFGLAAKAAAPALKTILDEDPAVSQPAAKALWQIGEHKDEALQTMTANLKKPHAEIAMADLATLGPEAKSCLPVLKPFLKSEYASMRISAAVAWCRIGNRLEEAIPVLAGILRENSEVACQAAEQLGELGPKAKAAVPALLRALAQDDFNLYQAAALALNKIDAQAAARAGISLHARPPRQRLSRSEVVGLWRDLTSHDPAKAYLAQWRLTQSTEQAVPLFAEFFPAVKPIPAESLANLLENLKSDEFRVRQKAHHELSLLGELAEGALRQSLAGKKSLEFARRVQKLLNDLEPDSPRRLRLIRTIQVLEFHHSAEARQLLEKLAKGIPEAWQTQEARLALERMKKSMKQ